MVTGEAFDITQNPNPQKAYKLKVEIKDAPAGGFKDFGGSVGFDIGNVKECGYYIGYGYQGIVPGVYRNIDFPLTQLSDSEYEGVFYTDWGKDGDFYGRGVCHWRFTGMGAGFRATGAEGETSFVIGFHELHDELTGERVVDGSDDEFEPKHSKTQTRFYRKETYPVNTIFTPNHLIKGSSNGGVNEEVAKQHKPEALFSITLTTEEMK